MTIKISDKAIKYNPNLVLNAFSDYTANLSSMKYVYNPGGNTKGIKSPLFQFGFCFEIEELILKYKENDKYYIDTHPYIEEIAPIFGYNLQSIVTLDENFADKTYRENKKKIYTLIGNIYEFAKNRYLTLTNSLNEDFQKISPIKDNQEEFLKILNYFIKTLPKKELLLNDYYYNDDNLKNHDYIKTPDENHKYILKTSSIYNYQTLREELIKFVTRENEYYNYFHDRKKIEEVLENTKKKAEEHSQVLAMGVGYQQSIKALNIVLKKYDDIIDYLNSSPFFTRENFAIMCIKIEPFIEKEKAVDNFIDKILEDHFKSKKACS